MTKAALFLNQRREVEAILQLDEDGMRSKLYELYEDINRYGNLVADQHSEIRQIREIWQAADTAIAAFKKEIAYDSPWAHRKSKDARMVYESLVRNAQGTVEQHHPKCPMHEDFLEPRNRLTECMCADLQEEVEKQMSKLTSLKEYNRVTARVREEFRRVKDQADMDFYDALIKPPQPSDLDRIKALLRRRDAAISDAYKGRREEAALAWQLYRSENPRPGA